MIGELGTGEACVRRRGSSIVWRVDRADTVGDDGFSLVELIIVVVIIGILVAIAIPIFVNIEAQAQRNAVRAAASDGAEAAAAAFVSQTISGANTIDPSTAAASAGSNGIVVTLSTSSNTATNVCVTATDGTDSFTAGPASPGDAAGLTCP